MKDQPIRYVNSLNGGKKLEEIKEISDVRARERMIVTPPNYFASPFLCKFANSTEIEGTLWKEETVSDPCNRR